MSRSLVLFSPDGKATLELMGQWRQRGGLQPIPQVVEVLEQDRSAKLWFRGLWAKAFPDRQPLPFGPLAERDGRGTAAFWDVFE